MSERPIVIVGGAGFIGSNLAESFLAEGRSVTVVDTLARPGVETNLAWLAGRFGSRLKPVVADVRNPAALADALVDAEAVFHFAAQVAVTTSLGNPVEDFDVNARGNAERAGGRPRERPAGTGDLRLHQQGLRRAWAPPLPPARGALDTGGAGTRRPRPLGDGAALLLHALRLLQGRRRPVRPRLRQELRPADRRPAHELHLRPPSVRHEDQGWVAHFLIRALAGEAITVYGDGGQVRDVLHVADTVAAYRALLGRIDQLSGRVYNLGGGPANAVSLGDVLAEIGRLTGRPPRIERSAWRTGDQVWFVADTRALSDATGWQPTIGWRDGLADLAGWLTEAGVVPDRFRRLAV